MNREGKATFRQNEKFTVDNEKKKKKLKPLIKYLNNFQNFDSL